MSKKADEERIGANSGLKGSPALLCFVSLTIIVFIPIAVMLLYSVDSPNVIKTPWSAGDMLGYCGTMGAAFIALPVSFTAYLTLGSSNGCRAGKASRRIFRW